MYDFSPMILRTILVQWERVSSIAQSAENKHVGPEVFSFSPNCRIIPSSLKNLHQFVLCSTSNSPTNKVVRLPTKPAPVLPDRGGRFCARLPRQERHPSEVPFDI